MAKGKRLRSDFGHIDDLGGGRYRVRLTAGKDADGVPVKFDETIRGTQRDAHLALMRLALRSGKPQTLKNLTVYEFVHEAWLPSKKGLRDSTRRGYERTVENHIQSAFGDVQLSGLLPYTVQQRLERIERPGAAKNAYKIMRNAMKYAVQSGMLDNDPMPAVPCPKVPKYQARVYDVFQMLELLDYFEGKEIEAEVVIAISCGLRRSEICGLDWQDVKLPKDGLGEVTVKRGYHGKHDEKGEVFEDPKSERSRRVVPIPVFAVERLRRVRGEASRIGALAVNSRGERLSPDSLTSKWRWAMGSAKESKHGEENPNEAPVPYIELKNLRHSYATINLAAGASIVAVSRNLGHSTVSITDTYYLRPGFTAAVEAADLFDALVRRSGKKTASAVEAK